MNATVAEIVVMEVTPEEMQSIIKQRELKGKQAAIAEKGQEVCKLIKELEELGGHVYAVRNSRNHYVSTGCNGVYGVVADSNGVRFTI